MSKPKKKRQHKTKKNDNKNKKIKGENCSPTRKNKFSCYSSDSLHVMKKYWNARHPDVKIHTNDGRAIWSQLRGHLSNVCNRESCWMRQKFMKGKLNAELKSYTFAPTSPSSWKKEPNTWLTSVDIEKVMKQYEKKYDCFEFIGPSPIDFDYHKIYDECVWEELCKFQLNDCLKRGKRKIGIIFNLDPHYKEGSHWVSLFIDTQKNFIFYFDSTGDSIPKEVGKLVKRIINQGTALNIDFGKTIVNNKEHQREDTECGIYSLYFIISMIMGVSYEKFLNERISDKSMERLRKIYFN